MVCYYSIISSLGAQTDSIILRPLVVKSTHYEAVVQPLPVLRDTRLIHGKKNEYIEVALLNTPYADKMGRQIFSKVPGIFVYDMDGSGNQMNISARGLDPHRSWEFNMRQNGVMTNSDIYGYPASHYSAPLESMSGIEVLRGTSALQYGAGFGGMINYVTKKVDTSKIFEIESIQGVGSFQTLSSYNAVGGKIGKMSYYAYAYAKSAKGYRDNAETSAKAQFIQLDYQLNKALKVRAELGRSTYLYRVPGPLTDSQFYQQPRQATRSRNYFNPDIYLPSLSIEWQKDSNLLMKTLVSLVTGSRNSVQFIGLATQLDTINLQTGQYKPRQVDIDRFFSLTIEWRMAKKYHLGRKKAIVSAGYVLSDNDLHRRQLGKGTTQTNYDLRVENNMFGRDLHFLTFNHAFFAENLIWLTPKWSVTPGIRFETGTTRPTGTIQYLSENRMPSEIVHRFPLMGLQTAYTTTDRWQWYAGFAQAYRPVTFGDIIPATVLDSTDASLQDAKGYNIDIGVKGQWRHWSMDMTAFQIEYNNRMGSVLLENSTEGQPKFLRTNVGNSRTQGVELLLEYKSALSVDKQRVTVSIFTATTYFHALYTKGTVVVGGRNQSIVGNRVETVPHWQSRNGLTIVWQKASCSLLHSFVAETFSDALNTTLPTPTGANGLVPSYHILDVNATYKLGQQVHIKAGIQNIANRSYFTKRPTTYPGAGVWPSEGRSFNLTLSWKMSVYKRY